MASKVRLRNVFSRQLEKCYSPKNRRKAAFSGTKNISTNNRKKKERKKVFRRAVRSLHLTLVRVQSVFFYKRL